jgi:hypothetical protein
MLAHILVIKFLAFIFAQVLATFVCQIFVKVNFSKKLSRLFGMSADSQPSAIWHVSEGSQCSSQQWLF